MLRSLDENGIEVGRPIENKDFDRTMTLIGQSGFKIAMLLMPSEEIAEFLCTFLQTSSRSAIPRIVWLLHTDVTDIPVELMLRASCPDVSNLELLTAFAIRYAPYDLMKNSTDFQMPHPSRVMCSQRPRRKPTRQLTELVTHPPSNFSSPFKISHYYRCYFFDSVKAIFIALGDSVETLGRWEAKNADSLINYFQNVQTNGKTGWIKFQAKSGERLGQVEVVQIAHGRPRWISVIDASAPQRHGSYSRQFRKIRWPSELLFIILRVLIRPIEDRDLTMMTLLGFKTWRGGQGR